MNQRATLPFVQRSLSALLGLVLLLWMLFLPLCALGESSRKTVRVGWYDSSFNIMDPNTGRRSGYAYEYQLKLAAYTGWDYEYVSGGWSTLLQKLENGEIDLLSEVSYLPEREEFISYPNSPMGTEEYYLFIAPSNHGITPNDPSLLNGKRIGVNKASLQEKLYLEWAQKHGIQAELVEVRGSEDESLRMLELGELDAYITVDSFTHPDRAVPVFKLGSSDIFCAVTRSRPDLLAELNSAISRIEDEDRYFITQLFVKYFRRTGANAFLTSGEVEWINRNQKIRIGYLDNHLAFCARDRATGELRGALKDWLHYASDSLANAHLDFETRAYPTLEATLDALSNGEVDAIFPISLSVSDADSRGLVMTPAIMHTDIHAIIRQSDQQNFFGKAHTVLAVPEGYPNFDSLIQDHFPNWVKVVYPTTNDCLKAVYDHIADCVLISNYRYNTIARLCEKYRFTSFATGISEDISFAVRKGEPDLYSILAKAVGLVPISTVNAVMSYHISEEARLSLADYIEDNLVLFMAIIIAVLLVILGLLFYTSQAHRKARRLISATETDRLTGLYSRNYFFQYANRMYTGQSSEHMDAIVVNIEQFHSVNELNGREFGDMVLRVLGSEIRSIAQEHKGIAGRFEADRFAIYCRHTDAYQEFFDRLQSRLDTLSPNTRLRLRMGVMPWQDRVEPEQLFDLARTACSMARGQFVRRPVIFDEKIRERELYEQRLQNDLRRALDSYEFEVFYQPVFDIQCEPPRLVSAEALVRWRHPEMGLIPPDDFIPLFERSGQIGEVDKHVWSEAARQISRWREKNGILLPVSVNLSRLDVFDPSLESTLDEILQYHALDYEYLRLEVTESAYTENADQLIRVVASLRRKGFKVEMDDFGAGYSSLNMLSYMPVDILKMDRGFVQDIETSEKDIHLVSLILGIARTLDIPVIAEGVETREQLRLLRDLGCNMVQGFCFSPPLDSSDFEARFLQNISPDI